MKESTPSNPHPLRPSFALIEVLVAMAITSSPMSLPQPSRPDAQKRGEIHQAARKGVARR